MGRLVATAVSLSLLAGWHVSAQRGTRETLEPRPLRQPSDTRGERQVPFAVGETLTYDVTWSALLTAGTVVASVKEKRPSYDSTAYYVVAEGRPSPLMAKLYPMYYKLDTLLDVRTLMAQRGSIYSEEGTQHRFRATTFDRAAHRAQFEYTGPTTVKTTYPVPPAAQDALAAVYVLRANPLSAGSRLTIPVTDNGQVYTLQLDVAARERVTVPFGDVNAWRVNPVILDDKNQPVGRNIAVWLSDDARRLPVKLQGDLPLGGFVLALRDAH
jgi:hypothetical protein